MQPVINLEKPRQYRGKGFTDWKWYFWYYIAFETGEHYIFSPIWWQRVNPETVGQYIGFNDDVGNALYEGDICELPSWKPSIHYVTFNRWGFCFWYEEKPMYLSDCKYLEKSAKIGNIFDNPELLKHFQWPKE